MKSRRWSCRPTKLTYQSELHPQSRSRTPPDIEISTPPAAENFDHTGLKEDAERDAHLDDIASAASSLRQQHSQVHEDSHVLLPTMPPVLFYTNPDKLPRSCSETLCKYIRAASSKIPFRERRHLRHLHKKCGEENTREGYNQFLQSFVKHTFPKDDLYDVVRAFDTADEMVFLRPLLLHANSAARWYWNNFCETLLLYAAKDSNTCLVVVLLDIGVNIHTRQPPGLLPHLNGLNAIQIAVDSGHKEVIGILDDRGATTLTGDRFRDFDFIADAITQGTMDIAQRMLTKAATSSVRTAEIGIELLVYAVKRSHDTVVDVLLKSGFNPYSNFHDELSILRESAFTVALRMDKTKYLKRFLEVPYHDFDSDQCQERLRQLTAGYVSACCSEDLDLKNAILDTGWNPDEVKGVMGYDFVQVYLYDALKVAVTRGDCDRVRCLTRIGASPNWPPGMILGCNAMTLLQWAMERGTMFMVRQLIAAGADVNLLSSQAHESPLQYAVSTWNLVLAKLLVEAGANVNLCQRRWSRSAIKIAAGGGQIEMVTYLVESGADIQGRHNRNYRRTLYRAKMAGHDSVVKLLQEWKKSKFGEQDCDTVDNIMEAMTLDELDFPSEEARIDYLERGQSDTESTLGLHG